MLAKDTKPALILTWYVIHIKPRSRRLLVRQDPKPQQCSFFSPAANIPSASLRLFTAFIQSCYELLEIFFTFKWNIPIIYCAKKKKSDNDTWCKKRVRCHLSNSNPHKQARTWEGFPKHCCIPTYGSGSAVPEPGK